MANWRDVLVHLADDVETAFDAMKRRLDRRFGSEALTVIPYDGFGTADKLWVRGRVLEESGAKPATERDSVWRNLVNTYRRFESDEVPGARVQVRYAGTTRDVVTDEEGFFDLELTPTTVPAPGWQDITYTVLEPEPKNGTNVQVTGQGFVVSADAQFGVISDIDDTVVYTGATSLLQMAQTVFLGNAHTRLPFTGVSALYQALHQPHGAPLNPICYVSSSPWNLYELLTEFMALHDIPRCPLLLRDWGLSREGVAPSSHHSHKLDKIEHVFQQVPDLPFLLIGDSGQEDPEIYAEMVERHPHRILGMYIRDVSERPDRDRAIGELIEAVAKHDKDLVLAADSVEMARHAVAQGWITEAALNEVVNSKAAEQQDPSPVEELLGTPVDEA